MSLPDYISERVADEIHQQMEGVRALTEQLGRQRLTPDGEACVSSVNAAADSVIRMLGAALDLRLVMTEKLSLNFETVRLRELADAIQDRWQARAASAGITLLVSYDGDPEASALADTTRLQQVFDGLIGEAVGAQGRGAVEASLQARDTGEGILLWGRVRGPRGEEWDPAEAEARIRLIDERLGLEVAMGAMLARSLLEQMGGKLHKEAHAGASDSVAFEMLLAPAPAEIDTTPSEDAGRAAHILVVDDNATNRMVAQSLVEMFDCTSESAEDGEEAVEAARSGRFDLILMDIKMPKMDGVAATRAIRALPGPVSRTPIIALTANADPEDSAGYLAAGMNGVVEKPMKPETLLQALQAALMPPDTADDGELGQTTGAAAA